ncbi:MAG: fibronectin type III domain-containing protein [Myxococcaceae bacterium]|nr:fibronectin type III domain-containing protein [Myxococcaceae bacterium]MCI0672367.1 fibronectin type III domain-containing protein [Myxococcaceae bacterium]
MNIRLLSSLVLVAALVACGGSASNAPEAPSSLTGMPMSGGFHLSWADNSNDETEFVVKQKVGEGSFTELTRVPFDTTQYMVESGEAGQHLVFRVMALNAEAKSAASNEVMWMP